MFEKFISLLGSLIFSISGFLGFPPHTPSPNNSAITTETQSTISTTTATNSARTSENPTSTTTPEDGTDSAIIVYTHYITGPWSTCVSSFITGVQTRSVTPYANTISPNESAPASSQSCSVSGQSTSITQTKNITVLSPNGEEQLEIGKQRIIRWSSSPTISKVHIFLINKDGRPNLNRLITESFPNQGYYIWDGLTTIPWGTPTAPHKIEPGSYSILIEGLEEEMNTVTDESAPFTISYASQPSASTGTVHFNATLDGVPLSGSSFNITSTGPVGTSNFAIPSDHNGQPTGNYTVKYVGPLNNAVLKNVTGSSLSGNSSMGSAEVAQALIAGGDILTFTFNFQSVITVLSPNGGELWQLGTPKTITWSAPSTVSIVDIGLIRADGIYMYSLAGPTIQNQGSFVWNGSTDRYGNKIKPSAYKIRITDFDTNNAMYGYLDDSDTSFTIVQK